MMTPIKINHNFLFLSSILFWFLANYILEFDYWLQFSSSKILCLTYFVLAALQPYMTVAINFAIMNVWAQNFVLHWPGHSWVLQSWVSVLSPWQSAPPWARGGLVQVLVLVWVPVPQVAEHSDQSSNSLHPPSTAVERLLYSLRQFWQYFITIPFNWFYIFSNKAVALY